MAKITGPRKIKLANALRPTRNSKQAWLILFIEVKSRKVTMVGLIISISR